MRIVDAIYDSIGDEQIYSDLPGLVANAINARSCVLQIFNPSGTLDEILFSYFSVEMNSYYEDMKLYYDDVWSQVLSDSSLYGKSIDMSRHVSENQYRGSRFYNDFFRKFGDDTGQCIGFGRRNGSGQLITVGFHRAFRDRPFSDLNLHRLNSLIPHLSRLFAARSTLANAERRAQLAEAGLDGVGHSVILADSHGRPLMLNQAADALLAHHDGLSITNGRLAAKSIAADKRLTQAIAEAVNRTGTVSASISVERMSGRHAYRVLVTPWAAGDRSCALILIDDPDCDLPDLAEKLAGLYSLTSAEAQIASLLTKGLSAEEIAERRGVSLATVRTQVQMVLRKTDTRRVSDLASLLGRLPHAPREE